MENENKKRIKSIKKAIEEKKKEAQARAKEAQARADLVESAELRKNKTEKYDLLVILGCLVIGFTLGMLSTWIVYLSI